MNSKIGYIYILTSPSGKCYVGQTWNIKNRFKYYKNAKKYMKQPKLYRAIQKYTLEKFSIDIVDMCYEQSELNDAEIYWINYFNSIENGYNCKEGGQYGSHSEESKLLCSKASKSYWKNHKNFKRSEENKRKISDGRKGIIPNRDYKNINFINKIKTNRKTIFKIKDPNDNIFYTNNLKEFRKNNNLSFKLFQTIIIDNEIIKLKWIILDKIISK